LAREIAKTANPGDGKTEPLCAAEDLALGPAVRGSENYPRTLCFGEMVISVNFWRR
jgi:hypothetical protein